MQGMVQFLIGLLLITLSDPLVGRELAERLYQSANGEYRYFLRQTAENKQEQQGLALLHQFEHIYQNFPNHPKAAHSLFRVGQLNRHLFLISQQKTYLDRSIRFFRKLIQEYPQSTLADDSQYAIGEIFEIEKQDFTLALLEFQKALQRYDGDQRNKSIRKIKKLQKKLNVTINENLFAVEQKEQFSLNQGGISLDRSRRLPKGELQHFRFWNHSDWAQMTWRTSRKVPFLYGEYPHSSEEEHLYFVDLLDLQPHPSLALPSVHPPQFIQSLQVKVLSPRMIRIIFASQEKIKFQMLEYELAKGNLLSMELKPLQHQPEMSKTALDQEKKIVVILDPGHGGFDPGAIGFGIQEKTIVLDFALALEKKFASHPQISVFLTRREDRFVSLEARTVFAKEKKGDLFVSLHVNAHPNPNVWGVSTYFLNLTQDQAVLALAQRENEMNPEALQAFFPILKEILQTVPPSHLSTLASTIHTNMVQNIQSNYGLKPRNLGVQEGPFLVLLRSEMPSALVELSFISHRKDNQRLQEPKFQKVVVEGMYQGILQYLQETQQR